MSKIGITYLLAQKFTFDPTDNSLIDQANDNATIRLGSNESRILTLLCRHPNEVISRDQLHEFVWRDQGFQVDDSSLTQAVSTLRKTLKDSTKSPIFVKTVPKRGYQLICPVETVETEVSLPEENLPYATGANDGMKAGPTTLLRKKAPFWAQWDTTTRILLLMALILPILVAYIPSSSPAAFRQVTIVNGIPVNTTEGHPDLQHWVDSIKMCVEAYAAGYPEQSKPVEVIATASQEERLFLNYIHSSEFTTENSTVRLVADLDNLAEICTKGARQ